MTNTHAKSRYTLNPNIKFSRTMFSQNPRTFLSSTTLRILYNAGKLNWVPKSSFT